MNCYKTDDNILQNGSSRLFSFVIISLEFTDAQHTHTTVNKCVMMQKWKTNKKKNGKFERKRKNMYYISIIYR